MNGIISAFNIIGRVPTFSKWMRTCSDESAACAASARLSTTARWRARGDVTLCHAVPACEIFVLLGGGKMTAFDAACHAAMSTTIREPTPSQL
ncbi:hypothetical protein [Bradyrhizobium sp. AZCC 1693]|uniref:hypothetical protein n=1 Tax=Bradyrhizobium sp. AZCC 1693 TaxID=3117029 RepID=UPI002FF390D3